MFGRHVFGRAWLGLGDSEAKLKGSLGDRGKDFRMYFTFSADNGISIFAQV